MPSQLIEKDHGWNALMKEVHRARDTDPHVRVGIMGEAASEQHAKSDFSNVDVATVQEFGTLDGHIPERSHVRATIDENGATYHDLAKTLYRRVLEGELGLHQALGIFGTKVASDMKRKIQRGIDPPLAESTIRAKQSSKPLIDTGQLIGSITYEVKAA